MAMTTRDPNRIDGVIEQLRAIWKVNPQMRLGQIILNAYDPQELYYVEDDALIAKLTRLLSEPENPNG